MSKRKILYLAILTFFLIGIFKFDLIETAQAKKIFYKKLPQYNFNPKTYNKKYIEVNLTQQKMYLWNKQIIVAEHLISSGGGKRFSPTGKYKIQWKRLKNNTYTGLRIPYSMKIVDQILIHQVPQKKNGTLVDQDKLGQPVSDGCIRVGVNEARDVYNWTPVGTPVYIHD